MKKQFNKNLIEIEKAWKAGKRGIVLKGGSRSGKTWSWIDFLVWLSTTAREPIVTTLVKETYNSFKTTLYNDFNLRLPQHGIDSPFENVKEVQSFKLFENKINLIGADQPSKFHGAGTDYFIINEALPVQKAIFDQLEMRCKKFWIMDFNPSVAEHWIYDSVEKRDDVVVVHSTMLDNPHVSKWEKKKILSYEPTPENRANGTADDFMWTVYGLGLVGQIEGVIYTNWGQCQELPQDVDTYWYGLDFGFVNDPTTLIKVCLQDGQVWVDELFYETGMTNKDISDRMDQLGIRNGYDEIIADSAEPKSIYELKQRGWFVRGVVKGQDSVKKGIDTLKQYRINVTQNSTNLIKELRNYKWEEDRQTGKAINKPVDAFNHACDAMRYVAMMKLMKRSFGLSQDN